MERKTLVLMYCLVCLSVDASANVPIQKEDAFTDLSDYELPEFWQEFCTVKRDVYGSIFTPNETLTHIECFVTDEFTGLWKMADLRRNLENATSNFSVSVTCSGNATVSVSWPMKVRNLHRMKVKDCVVTDFLGDYKNDEIDIIPDSLRELELNSNRIMISISRFLDMLKNILSVSKEFECGHETTVEKMTIRNISYDFMDTYDSSTNLAELGEQFMLDSKRINYKCDFVRLIYLDEGDSDSFSIYHLTLLTEASIYDHMRVYNISHNHMAVLQDKVLQWSVNFPKLELLDLSHNDISTLYRFEVPVHTRMSQITTINLQHNNLSTFTVQDIQWFEKMPMVLIDLRNNPIACNCTTNMKQLISFIKDDEYFRKHNLSNYNYIKNMTCASPPSMVGKTLGELSPEVLPCEIGLETEYFIVPLICLSASVIALSVILFILVKYRREVRILMYTRFHVVLPCQMKEADDSKMFDAFVSYSSNDEQWVESVFEKLEDAGLETSGKAFKFCLHHRDFVPGRTIFSNVINSVEASRHTIILISKSFLKSEYCLYEFHEAFQQSIIEQKRHLVIVMMEDIAESELPKDLKRCIKTFTYIKKDDFLFQDRLIYALSVRERSQSSKTSGKSDSSSKSRSSTNGRKTSNGKSNGYSNGYMNGRTNGFANGFGNIRPNGALKNGQLALRRSLSSSSQMEVIIEEDIKSVPPFDRSQSCQSHDTGYDSCRSSTVQVPGSTPSTPTSIEEKVASPDLCTKENGDCDVHINGDVAIDMQSA